MKFTIANEHRLYFEKHQQVELDGFFTFEQLQKLQFAIESSISSHEGVVPSKFRSLSPEKQFAAGRDLWRRDPVIKKWVANFSSAQIIADLIDKKQIRLGYDQFLSAQAQAFCCPSVTLQEICCFQGVLCGALIALTDNPELSNESVFPKKKGNVVYFAPEKQIDFTELRKNSPNGEFLLIVYVGKMAIYIKRENDPHVYFLRNLGYDFGDRLNDQSHPIIYR